MTREKVLFILSLLIAVNTIAQNSDIKKPDFIKKSVKYHGNFSLSTNYYTATNFENRRPTNVIRMNYTSKLEVGRFFKMPINIMMSSLPVHFGEFGDEKSIGEYTARDFYVNPANTVQTGLYYKKVKLDLGTNSTRYSDLTMSGLPMFGAGFTWNPGKFIVQGNYGVSAHAIEQDSANSVAGQYRREIKSFKFGYGKLDKNYVAFNFVHGKDDTSSVASVDTSVYAQTGLVTGIDFLVTFSKKVKWKGEIAGSVFTRNQKSDDFNLEAVGNSQLTRFSEYFPFTYSTFADFAAKTSLMQNYKLWSLNLQGEYIGAGYITMGQPFMQNDRVDLTANPSVKLFKGKINWSVNGGYRVNNLSGIKSSTLNQVLLSTNVAVQLNRNLSVVGSYSNFGINNNVVLDTLRVQNVTQTYSVIPTYNWKDKGGQNTVNASAVMNDFQDFNVVSGALSSNTSTVYSGGYNRTFTKIPLRLGLSGSQFDLKSQGNEVHTSNTSLVTGYSFFKKSLKLNLTTTYSLNRSNQPQSDNQISLRLSARYTSPFGMSLNLSASNNEYNYAATSALDFYRENLFNISVSQKF